ncbi:antitermination protein [Leclercia sp.]|uniref:antitermination protein Q n=1 Tax=Leclercia sp. TaxID=1898428 RepID=UPI0028BD750A|nr:antitermination protein [Leclercia sp.]
MKLESVVKCHCPRSASPSVVSSPCSPDDISGTDIMAALGMALKRAPLGYSAFCGKMNLSHHDKERTVRLLTAIGVNRSVFYPALRKLVDSERLAVVRVLANYAFLDYARSPDTELPCHACNSTGWKKGKRCTKCGGKGVMRAACKDCKGRGQSVHRQKTQMQGVPVYQHCQRCAGRGFERIASAVVFRAVCQVSEAISQDTWNKSVKQLLSFLISELYREEAWAEKHLSVITK